MRHRTTAPLLLGLGILFAFARPEPLFANPCVWTGATSTAWATVTNWSTCGGVAPQPADTVAISSGGNQPSLSAAATVGVVTVNSGATLTVASGGTLTLPSGLTGAGALTVDSGGTLNWAGGAMDGSGTTTISPGATLMLTGTAKNLGRTLDIGAGQPAVMSGVNSYVNMLTGSAIHNSGTIDIQNDQGFFSSQGTIFNSGTLQRSISGSNAFIQCPMNNTGTVSVLAGTLSISGDGTHTGLFSAAGHNLTFDGGTQTSANAVTAATLTVAGAAITFNGAVTATTAFTETSGSMTVNGVFNSTTASSFNNGTAVFNSTANLISLGSSLTVGGTVTFSSGEAITVTTLNVTGTLQGSDDISVSGTFTWGGGTIGGTGALNANGTSNWNANSKNLARTLNIAAGQTATMTGSNSYINMLAGSTLNNAGTIDIQNDQGFFSSGGTIFNTATLTRSTSAATATIQSPMNNTGTVNVTAGTLVIGGDGVHTGPFNASGHALNFNGGTQTSAGSVTAATLTVGGAVITFNGAVTATTLFTQSAGTMTVNGPFNSASVSTLSNGTATFNPAATLTSLGSTLTVGGTATFSSGEAINVITLNQTGTIQGSDNITVSGTHTWGGGALGGTGTTNANGPSVWNANSKNLARTLNLAAGQFTTMSGSNSYVNMLAGSTLNNAGTIDIQNDQGFFSSGGTIFNTGTLTRSTSAGIATIQSPMNNTGVVNVQSGTLTVGGDGTHTGPFNAAGNALNFNGGTQTSAGSVTAANLTVSGATITFNGSINATTLFTQSAGGMTVNGPFNSQTASNFANGTATFNAASTLTSLGSTLTVGGTVTFSSGEAIMVTTLNQTGTIQGSDNITVSGTYTWGGGTLGGTGISNANGTSIWNANSKNLQRQLNLAAGQTATMFGANSYINMLAGSALDNAGTIDIQNDQGFFSSGGTIFNTGTLTRSTSTGTATIQSPMDNTGTVTVTSGTLTIGGDGTHTGPFNAAGNSLAFNGGTQTSAGPVSAANLTVSGATITFNGSVTATTLLTQSAGTMTVNGPFNSPTASSFTNGAATFNPAATLTSIGATLTVGGSVTFSSGEAINVTTLNQTGTIQGSDNITVSGTYTWSGGTLAGTGISNANGTSTWNLNGKNLQRTLNVAAGQTATMSNANSYINMLTGSTLNNAGTIDIQNDQGFFSSGGTVHNSGTLERSTSAGVANVQGPLANTGSISVQTGTLAVSDFTQTAGSTSLAGGNITATTNPLRIQGGTLVGTGTVTGNVTATAGGALGPGFSPGTLTITGNYTQSSPAAFNAEIAGTSAGQFDKIAVGGAATIGGVLNLSLLSFSPVQGDAFQLIPYASHVGTYGTYNLPPLAGGLSWVPRYGATAFSLRVQALLPDLPLRVDVHAASAGTHNLNGVLDPGERVLFEPTWKNPSFNPITFTGAVSNFAGPAGAIYTISKAGANFGTLSTNQSNNCFTATGNCYELSVDNPATRPAAHWDATLDETASNGDLASWTIHIGGSFVDVAQTAPQYRFVETLFHNLITGGCGAGAYCPATTVTRAQMAVFLLKANFGASYLPPPATGTVFADVPLSLGTAAFIENLAALNVTGGCGNGNYCPAADATRGQMAVFLLKTEGGPSYTPPPCVTPTFGDVPCASGFASWIEELVRRGITAGCGNGNYCPASPVTRGQMAVFLTTTFGLILNGP